MIREQYSTRHLIADPHTALLRDMFGEQGFSACLSLVPDELATLKAFIHAQYSATLRPLLSDYDTRFGQLDIDQYHTISHLIDHRTIWRKRNRCLPRDAVETLKQFSIFDRLREALGDFAVSRIVYENNELGDHEEVYWRLVRPMQPTDVGALHTDQWFNDILHLDGRVWPNGSYTIKVWIAVCCEPGLSGLSIVPGSHKRPWPYDVIMVDGNPRPALKENPQALCIPTPPGNALVFPEETLHGGVTNRSDTTRVSVEISIVLPERPQVSF